MDWRTGRWMDGQMGRWTGRRMDGQTDGRSVGSADGLAGGKIRGQTSGMTDGWMDGPMTSRQRLGLLQTDKMDNCTFPRYSDNDIVVHIRNSLLSGNEAKIFSKSDLFPNVKPEILHMIFMRALQSVYGIRMEHFYMMPVTFETAYPQIFEGFLPIGNLFINMERFLPICRVNDFQIADIINPKAKRTTRFLSGILNFLFFCNSRREVYLEIQSAHKTSMEKEQQLQVAIQDATLKLEKMDIIPSDQQVEFKELSQEIQELQNKLNQEYRQKTNVLQEVIHQKRMKIAEKNQNL
ncbi:kinetochore protein Nuf2-like, partial [Crotalus tigris]|uniref:kinetochore protein Nuf2-like n=1 Tax=Crotalus tigris TaxID=88082 RepID=UPI00192F4907